MALGFGQQIAASTPVAVTEAPGGALRSAHSYRPLRITAAKGDGSAENGASGVPRSRRSGPGSARLRGMASVRALAAANNAKWCDVVCGTHGLEPVFGRDAWTSRTRTPPYYPSAVTLVPGLSVPELLARVDRGAGCSIKDSFASLDLTEFGFRVLFEAEWIVRGPIGGRSAPFATSVAGRA